MLAALHACLAEPVGLLVQGGGFVPVLLTVCQPILGRRRVHALDRCGRQGSTMQGFPARWASVTRRSLLAPTDALPAAGHRPSRRQRAELPHARTCYRGGEHHPPDACAVPRHTVHQVGRAAHRRVHQLRLRVGGLYEEGRGQVEHILRSAHRGVKAALHQQVRRKQLQRACATSGQLCWARHGNSVRQRTWPARG